jgi:Centriolar protein SAS N-terminal
VVVFFVPASVFDLAMTWTGQVILTSENNPFFYYFDDCDEDELNKRRIEQKLTLDYSQYANVLTQLFNNCIAEPQTHLAVLILEEDGVRARLDFIKVCSALDRKGVCFSSEW